MLPEIKVYKIDYDFIVKNYLDRSLWKRIWNLFVYRDNVFTLNLYEIDTENNKIRFKVKFNKLQWNYESVTYDVDNTPLQVLLQQINGAMFRLIETYERYEIKELPIYEQADRAVREERERLRDIAKTFLDSEGVTNGDIRDAYIDKFVDKFQKANADSPNLHKYKSGIKVAKSALIFGTLYKFVIPVISTFLAEKYVERKQKA